MYILPNYLVKFMIQKHITNDKGSHPHHQKLQSGISFQQLHCDFPVIA